MFCVTFSKDGEHILSGGDDKKISEWEVPEDALPDAKASFHLDSYNAISTCFPQILPMYPTARHACITGDLSKAEDLLTQRITADPNNYNTYASRSLVMARKFDWNCALDDALKVRCAEPS